MGRFELNSDCHVTALQAQSKLAISPSYEVRFCYISTCWKDNFNIFPMDLIPQSYIFCTSRSSRNNCQVMLSPCLFQVMVESDLGLWLACVPYSLGLMPMYLQIGFYLCLSSRVSPTKTRRHPISSTLPILLDRDWECDQDCFLGALLRILQWIPIF